MLVIRIDGLDDLKSKVSELERFGMLPEFRRGLIAVAGQLADDIRARAPYDERRRKGTHLRDAIFVGPGDRERPDVLVGVNRRKAPHAHLVEYGTRRWSGKPFFRPAIEIRRGEITERIKALFARLLSEARR